MVKASNGKRSTFVQCQLDSGQLQFKWQCYDAYCRVCLGLGLSLWLQTESWFRLGVRIAAEI